MLNKTISIRFCKILLLVSATLLLLLSFIDNLLAYDINYEYVKHVLSMDDTFKHPALIARSIHNPIYYHLSYVIIIVLEGLASMTLCLGVLKCFKNVTRTQQQFQQAKYWGQIGLLFSLFIYCCLFYVLGAEWFASWQSLKWNSKTASTPFIIFLGIIYLIFSQPDEDF
jgi:predicted small integral membrane protein